MNIEKTGDDTKKDILRRLNKIEGQVKGIQRMIQSEKQCGDVLTQISAVRAATNKVGVLLLERYSKDCILNSINSKEKNNEEVLDEFLTTVKRFLKFVEQIKKSGQRGFPVIDINGKIIVGFDQATIDKLLKA